VLKQTGQTQIGKPRVELPAKPGLAKHWLMLTTIQLFSLWFRELHYQAYNASLCAKLCCEIGIVCWTLLI
jgi:hypothetical protein